MDRYCILIDERDQSSTLKSIKRGLKDDHGINLIYTQLNPSESRFQSISAESETPTIDLVKISDELKSIEYFRRSHTIAIDYNLVQNELDGFQVAKLVRGLGYKVNKKILLYSAGIERAIDTILMTGDLENKKKSIAILVKSNIEFVDRDDYQNEIVKHIRQDPDFDFNLEVIQWLHKFGTHTYQGVFGPYVGKSFEEIATEIEHNTHQSRTFRKFSVEELFSYMIELHGLE